MLWFIELKALSQAFYTARPADLAGWDLRDVFAHEAGAVSGSSGLSVEASILGGHIQ